MKKRITQVIDAVMLIAAGLQIIYFIGSAPVPKVHMQRECIPIGAALQAEEAQPEYEQIGDWIVKK